MQNNSINLIIISLLIFIFSFPRNSYAIYDPLSVPNNKYGIHVIDENDIENAAILVNSSNGDWGYVTIVITENDREEKKWQNIFNRLKSYHLIPIVRIATKMEGSNWAKPDQNEILPWINFLNGLSWPVKNRYVILYNEPNHAKEYGGLLDPLGYADLVSKFSDGLKSKSDDFFVMMAGFDASAPNGPETMNEYTYLQRMMNGNSDVFGKIDGWVSHSYPNPNFSGHVDDYGRGTLRTYLWEINLLKYFGIGKEFPVFITETGWVHMEGEVLNPYYHDSDSISRFIIQASEDVWKDNWIVAVTPFVLNYPVFPFSHFSWIKPDGINVYPQYDSYRSIPKVKGEPLFTELKKVEGVQTKSSELNIKQNEQKNNEVWQMLLSIISKIKL